MISATGVVFLPAMARFALEAGSDVLSVAFARGPVATLILFAAVVVVASLRFEKLALPQS